MATRPDKLVERICNYHFSRFSLAFIWSFVHLAIVLCIMQVRHIGGILLFFVFFLTKFSCGIKYRIHQALLDFINHEF